MITFSPAFKVVDQIAGINFNHRKCLWVQNGSDSCRSLLEWVATNCEEIREMNVVQNVKYVGTMIGLEVHIHRWTAPRKNIHPADQKINASTKSLVERLCDLKVYAISLLEYIGSISALDKASLKDESHASQTTAGPYNAISTNLLRVGLRSGKELPPTRAHSLTAKKITQLTNMIVPPFMLTSPNGRRNS